MPGPLTLVPGCDIFDARLILDYDRYKLDAYASNFTDKTCIASQSQSACSATCGFINGAPRQYGQRGTVNL